MNSGFSMIEMLAALTLTLALFGMIASGIPEGISVSRKISGRQKVLESLFLTVDTIKSDLTKCGMRLQEAADHFGVESFSHTDSGFKVIYGLAAEELTGNGYRGDIRIQVTGSEFFQKKRQILIYDKDAGISEILQVRKPEKNILHLSGPLKSDHLKHSMVIPIREIEMKLYKKEKILKRKIDRGYFQPVMNGVTDFYISFFEDSNSVLYRLEIDGREQVRGYIFLTNRMGA